MPLDQITLRSTPRGFLWVRLILRVLLSWFLYFLLFLILLAWLGGFASFLIIGITCLVFAVLSSILIIYDHPLGWTKREVAFDFREKQILLLNGFDHQALPDILDNKDYLSIPFSYINHLSIRPYESKIFRPIYRISVVTAAEKIRLLVIKSPTQYTLLWDQCKAANVKVKVLKT